SSLSLTASCSIQVSALSLHDALPILALQLSLQAEDLDERMLKRVFGQISRDVPVGFAQHEQDRARVNAAKRFKPGLERVLAKHPDRKSTRLNSSHVSISYAVFCLKKK